MLEIRKDNKYLELEFNGIKLIEVNNPTKFYREVLLNAEITIDSKIIHKENIIYINELSKVTDFLNLSKKSQLTTDINDLIDRHPIINSNSIKEIELILNVQYQDLIESGDGDISKIINSVFDLKNDFLNINLFDVVINKCFDSKKIIIFDNVTWFNIEFFLKYINTHDFVLITNNVFQYINKFDDLQMVTMICANNESVCLRDPALIKEYLEKSINQEWLNKLNTNSDIKMLDDWQIFQISNALKKLQKT